MATIIQLRNDTAANFTTYNPVLAQGEIGLELDTKKIKVGDGVKTWNQLDYWVGPLTSEQIIVALGYTPYDSSNPSGYISGITSTDVIEALGFTPYSDTNPDGYISGITSNDVVTALGFTPYDSSNPAGYTNNVGTVTSVNNIEPVNGNVTIEIPDTATWGNITGTLSNQTDLQSALDNKVDKTTTANKVYGTDANGDQTTYDVDSFGQVDDVTVNGTSVVTNKVANIPIGTSNVLGVYKVNPNQGISAFSSGDLCIISASELELTAKTQSYKPIVPNKLDIAVREGLGNNSLTWTDAYKANARNTIGATQAVFVDWSD